MIATLRIVGTDLPGRAVSGRADVHCGVQSGYLTWGDVDEVSPA